MTKPPRIQTLMVLGTAVWLLAPRPGLAQPVNKVLLAEARLKELPATSLLIGSVRPNRISIVGAEVEGLVTVLPVRQGDYLKKGTLICRLNDDTLQLELGAAEGRLQSLSAAVLIANADLQRWTREKERVARLEDTNRTNAKEVYDTLADFLMAENRVREAEQDVVEQNAQVEMKKIEIAKTRIGAPFDGYVTALHTEVGQWLQRGGPVVEIIDLETVLVRVDAPESAIAHIQVGDEARVSSRSMTPHSRRMRRTTALPGSPLGCSSIHRQVGRSTPRFMRCCWSGSTIEWSSRISRAKQ